MRCVYVCVDSLSFSLSSSISILIGGKPSKMVFSERNPTQIATVDRKTSTRKLNATPCQSLLLSARISQKRVAETHHCAGEVENVGKTVKLQCTLQAKEGRM